MRDKVIFMIHGLGGGISEVQFSASYIQRYTDLDVVMITLKGHDQRALTNVRYEEWIEECDAAINELFKTYEHVYILGFSMGGVIATYLASKYKRIEKVILVAPAFYYLSISGLIVDFSSFVLGTHETSRKELLEEFLTNSRKNKVDALIEFRQLVHEKRYSIAMVHQPLLVFHGLKDSVVPIRSAYFAMDLAPARKKSLVLVRDGRHRLLTGSKNEEISQLLIQFLSGKQVKNQYI